MLDRSPPSALEASLELHNTMTTPKHISTDYTLVRKTFETYDPIRWMDLITCVNEDFGRSGHRWQWTMNNTLSVGNAWVVDFYFENPHDATIFQLKY